MLLPKRMLSAACSICMLSCIAAPLPIGAADLNHVVINEVCAKNTTFAAADGQHYDWIELYNPTNASVDLSGYGLSDDADNLYRYTFPNQTVIPAKQKLLVFCNSTEISLNGQLSAAFGLSTDGETLTLTSPDGKTIDTITFGIIETNISYGRTPDGSDLFAFMDMTPGADNNTDSIIELDIEEPVLSKSSGFYQDAFQLSISAADGLTIRYSMDGSDPTAESPKYSAPIAIKDISSEPNGISAITDIAPSSWMSQVSPPAEPVHKAMIIKAAAFDAEGNRSDVVTGTYFIGYQAKADYYQNMKVISLVTDSDNLFDNEIGIYVMGQTYTDWKNGPEYNPMAREWEIPANYTQSGAEWEREATMQIIENGSLAVSQNVGLRIHGGATRSSKQKSFNVYSRSEYGTTSLAFDLFSGNLTNQYDGDTITDFDSFMIRNGGNDGQATRFRDKLNQMLVSDRNFLTQAMEPCIVFINGEFWGHYEITEKLSEDMIKSHYDVSKKNVCIIKNEELDEGDEEGLTEFEALEEWIEATDFSSDANYTALCDKIDMQSFIDYISAEIYYNNTDWGGNNMAMWKSMKIDESNPYADGKWRFILFDTEYSVNLYNMTPSNANTFSQLQNSDSFLGKLYKAALKNETFREAFALTFMDMANYHFDSKRTSALIDDLTASYHDFVVDTLHRFWPDRRNGEESTFTREAASVKSFYDSRFSGITNHMRSALSLKGNLAKLTISNDDNFGTITVNTISPEMVNGSWSGSYYTDYPVTITANAKAGARFSHWETSEGKTISTATAQITLKGNMTVTAVYELTDVIEGDVNLDGSFNMADIVCLQKHLMTITPLSTLQAKVADVHKDQIIDANDYTVLKRMLLNQ